MIGYHSLCCYFLCGLSVTMLVCMLVCCQQGNITDFMNLTGWCPDSVLYVGDHVYTDLAVCTIAINTE